MKSKQEAEKIAQDYIDSMSKEIGLELSMFHNTTEEFNLGWVFKYDSKKFIDTDNFEDRLAGNVPFLVTKSSGEIIELGTAHTVSYYITELEKSSE